LGSLAQIPVELFTAGYSKQQELDADREGTILAVSAGYSPQGAIQMFQKFQKVEDALAKPRPQPKQSGASDLPIDIANVVIVQSIEEYFRTHPPNAERIAQIDRLIVAEHWPSNQIQKRLPDVFGRPS
jgi:predicted Zn-dependent protease